MRDRARHGHRLAEVVGVDRVEQAGVTRRVGADFERVGQAPEAVFAFVERVAEAPVRRRVGVRHEHLRQRSAIEDRTHAAVVFIADGVEDEPFARMDGEPEAPLLPAHFVAVHGEAGALRLHVLQRLRRLALRADRLGVEVGGLRRQRHHAEIDDALDLHLGQVDERDHAFDRPRVAVVLLALEIRERAHPARRARLGLRVEQARRPRIDLHVVRCW